MKLKFNHFKKILFESMLDEDKSRLIDKLVLPDIEDEEEKQKAKEEMKAFFKKYNTWENKLDWNKLSSITYADFEKIKNQASQTKGSQKREIEEGDIKAIFKSVGNRKFEIVGENDTWLFVAPLSYEAAVYCDSSENQGAGAKWCIGYEKDSSYWKSYTRKQGSVFVMSFNKNYKSLNRKDLETNLKYMIEKTKDGKFITWDQQDKKHPSIKFLNQFNTDILTVEKYFQKATSALQLIQKEIEKQERQILDQKIKNLKNISILDQDYFTDDERDLLTELIIPGNIKEIKGTALNNCHNLEKLIIENGVTKIGNSAFVYCDKLQTIMIPDSVTNIEDYAFKFCYSLTNVIIPKSVIKLGIQVFNFCEKLQSIKLPNSIKEIPDDAFADCSDLKNIIIPNGVKKIGNTAFANCYSLKSLTIPKSVIEIGEDAFTSCDNLSKIIFNGKNIKNIKLMENYPWDIEDPEEIITVK